MGISKAFHSTCRFLMARLCRKRASSHGWARRKMCQLHRPLCTTGQRQTPKPTRVHTPQVLALPSALMETSRVLAVHTRQLHRTSTFFFLRFPDHAFASKF